MYKFTSSCDTNVTNYYNYTTFGCESIAAFTFEKGFSTTKTHQCLPLMQGQQTTF